MNKSLMAKLKSSISMAQQTSIFGGSNTKVLENCVEYLRHYGYTVISPKKFEKQIKNSRDLIEYFYELLNRQTPGNYATSYNEVRDLKIAKSFVEGRMAASGTSKEYALNECGEIVKTIFDNYDEFNFKYQLNFSIFGQSKLKWVTDRAIQIMNKKLYEKEEEEAEVLRQKALDSYEDDHGFSDIDEILRRIEEDEDA